MSDKEVSKTPENVCTNNSDSPKSVSCSTAKEKSNEVVRKESENNIASVQLEVGAKKDCLEEGLNETQNDELVAKLAGMEKSKSENGLINLKENTEDKKTANGQATDSNNASNSEHPRVNQVKAILYKTLIKIDSNVSRTLDAVEKLCDKFEDFCQLGNRTGKDYKSHFDAMYAKVLEETEKGVPRNDIKSLPTSSHVDNSAENILQANISDNKTDECEFLSQVGPGDLVLILDSTLFRETTEEKPNETTEGDDAGLTYTIEERKDQQNKPLDAETNTASEKQETAQHCNAERGMRVLEIQPVDFKAKHLEPSIKVERDIFHISLDVSVFDIENITCVVGEKLDVQARVSRRNDYGSETHEIHQMFEVPVLADRRKFTACIQDGFLHLEAPMKHGTSETLTV